MKKLLILGFLPAFLYSTSLFAQSKTELISVDGIQMRAKTSGLTERKAHQPIVILEAGTGESLEVWNAVFDQIAEFSPVLAYDRVGLGKSAESAKIPSVDSRVKDLEALLAEMNIQPPYVLAGNNWGNLLIREFAEDHPSEVEGMIYVDPVLDIENTEQLSAYLTEKGLDGDQLAAEYMSYQAMRASNRSGSSKAEAELFMGILNDNELLWSSQAVPEVTSLVILGRRFNVFPMMGSLSMNSGEFFNLLIESKMEYLDEYSSIHP
ncbi:MAG: alpha/beta hydrolase, partial [Algoriphagus sp.]